MTKVLVAFDESPVSRRAAAVAGRLFAGADTEFLAISVAEVPTAWGDPFGGVYALPQSFWNDLPPDGLTEEDVAAEADASGLRKAEPLVEVGAPVDRIIAAAEEHDVDVIVVGAHHKGFLRKLVDPSISEGVIHRAHRPVLVVAEEQHDHKHRHKG